MVRYLAQGLTQLGVFAAQPAAFGIATLYVVAWLIFDRASFDWHSSVTVATWFMTLFIQRAEHRDTQAIHAKLDALLRADGRPREELTHIDDKEPEAIVEHRAQARGEHGAQARGEQGAQARGEQDAQARDADG